MIFLVEKCYRIDGKASNEVSEVVNLCDFVSRKVGLPQFFRGKSCVSTTTTMPLVLPKKTKENNFIFIKRLCWKDDIFSPSQQKVLQHPVQLKDAAMRRSRREANIWFHFNRRPTPGGEKEGNTYLVQEMKDFISSLAISCKTHHLGISVNLAFFQDETCWILNESSKLLHCKV